MSTKPSWFRFYPADWLLDRSVRGMTLSQKGAYIDLLAILAREGELPGEVNELRHLVGISTKEWVRIWRPPLSDKFPLSEDGKRSNAKLIESLEGWKTLSRAGIEGNQKRWHPTLPGIGGESPATRNRTEQNKEQNQEQKEHTTTRARKRSRVSRVVWDDEEKRIRVSDEYKADFLKRWRKEFSLEEIGQYLKGCTRWLARPEQVHRRTARSRIDRTLENWMENRLEEKQSKEEILGAGRTPLQEEESKQCKQCRETRPTHARWCPVIRKEK